jgi:hypothetical protein
MKIRQRKRVPKLDKWDLYIARSDILISVKKASSDHQRDIIEK